MKRYFIFILIFACLLTGCSNETPEATEATTEPAAASDVPAQLPRGLEGNWVSATVSDRGYSESITFNADGSLIVESLKNGKVENSIYGKFTVEGHQIVFEIIGGTTPYTSSFDYTLDGRELYLIDDDGPAHYLRTS